MERPKIAVVAHNIRSTHNIGSIFRTCDGFGVEHIYLSGYSPYPKLEDDTRLPHIAEKATNDIHKTALGAEQNIPFSYIEHIERTLEAFKAHGYTIVGLEQDEKAQNITEYSPHRKIVLLLGEEVEGIPRNLREICDDIVEIPMLGQKESFNVSVAAGIAIYGLTYSKS